MSAEPRYVVRETEGFLNARGTRRGNSMPGVTCVVLDSLVLYRVVGLFRSEPDPWVPINRRLPREQAIELARTESHALAARLNRSCA